MAGSEEAVGGAATLAVGTEAKEQLGHIRLLSWCRSLVLQLPPAARSQLVTQPPWCGPALVTPPLLAAPLAAAHAMYDEAKLLDA